MVVLLLLLVFCYVKSNLIYEDKNITYLHCLGIPLAILTIIFAVFLY